MYGKYFRLKLFKGICLKKIRGTLDSKNNVPRGKETEFSLSSAKYVTKYMALIFIITATPSSLSLSLHDYFFCRHLSCEV